MRECFCGSALLLSNDRQPGIGGSQGGICRFRNLEQKFLPDFQMVGAKFSQTARRVKPAGIRGSLQWFCGLEQPMNQLAIDTGCMVVATPSR